MKWYRDICTVYLDDILVMGATFEELLYNLKCVFDHLQSAGLHLKPSKCYLIKKEVEYFSRICYF